MEFILSDTGICLVMLAAAFLIIHFLLFELKTRRKMNDILEEVQLIKIVDSDTRDHIVKVTESNLKLIEANENIVNANKEISDLLNNYVNADDGK